MTCAFEPLEVNGRRLWRIGRAPDPWQFVDWTYADQNGHFDGRWDDPEGTYRVL